jgi:hypothetical protein
MEEYKILKLKSGDSIIAAVSEVTPDNKVNLHRPMLFKTVPVVDENMNVNEALLLKNWAEYSVTQDIEISTDIIAASWYPDVVILNCYEMEKIKQDMPELYKKMKQNSQDDGFPKVNPPIVPGLPPMPPFGKQKPPMIGPPPGMANFNLNLPLDVVKGMVEYLEQQGINLNGPDFNDMDDDQFDDELMEDELNDKTPDNQGFGNHPDDWSPDPKDYLK